MGKDKFKKRKEARRLIRGEMTKRGITGREVAARLNIDPSSVSKYCATSPRIIEALIKAGVPARLFKHAPSPKSPLTPLYKGGEGEGEKEERTCAG